MAGKREPWLVNPPYQSVVEFLVTSSEASDADHFCSKVTNIHRVPVCAPGVVWVLVATWIACLFLDIAGVVSASCECCFSISYPGLWVLMLFAYEILSSFFLFGLPFSFAYNYGFTLRALSAQVYLHRTEAWYIMAECLEIAHWPLPVSQNDKPLWLLFIQCTGTCFLVLSPVRYYRLSPLNSSWFFLIPLGFPNVTVAPNCDVESCQGPIIQKCDPPTELSILSESVMDSQVMYILFHTCPMFLGCTK